MIAHIAGLPFEEAVAQMGPMVVGAMLAARLLRERARAWARSLDRRRHRLGSSLLGTLVLALLALASSASALAEPSPTSAATITGSFSDACRDFTASSSKDISHVELRYADGRVVKDETVNRPDYAVDGGAGDELDSALVKSGTTRTTFTCPTTNGPPTAVLEIQTPPLSDCTLFPWPVYPTCLASSARTAWSRPPAGELAFIFVSPVPAAELAFSFRGTSSTDPDGDIASWSIDFGDGATASGGWGADPPSAIIHAYASPFYGPDFATVTLTVTDGTGQTDSDTITLIGIDGTPD